MYSWVDEGVRVVDGRSELKASAVRRTRCANRRHWAGDHDDYHPAQAPWHLRAGGGAVHSINCGSSDPSGSSAVAL